MAPSRGLMRLRQSIHKPEKVRGRFLCDLAHLAADPARKTQIYLSRSLDPYLNLSIEHFLLQKSRPDSTILFLYTNKPCIVLGRNQNPWVEVNLRLLNQHSVPHDCPNIGQVSLVRRRSGGGTVFHDEGNVNYSVICPTAMFDRDKHAQMVVRALHQLGVNRAMVNQRHDIILSQDALQAQPDLTPVKVSGSAYKLTRLRSLHHGTCLLSSPNIHHISQYLRSPAKPYIKARGVDSVSSPIANVNVSTAAFEDAVIAEFGKMYGSPELVTLTDETVEVPEIAKGLSEIKSLEWIYMQTPQFTFSSHGSQDSSGKGLSVPDHLPQNVTLSFTARNGSITDAKVAMRHAGASDLEKAEVFDTQSMTQRKVHTIEDWADLLPKTSAGTRSGISTWLNELFGKAFPHVRACIFDMDGLLLNTEDIYTLCADNVLLKYGRPRLPWSVKAQLMGVPCSSNGDVFHNWAQLPIPREQYAKEQAEQQKVHFPECEPLPGAQRLLSDLKKAHNKDGIPIEIALASSSEKNNYDRKASRPETKKFLDLVPEECRVLGDDPRVQRGRGKPAPDIYLLALQTINSKREEGTREIVPEECLVFEDSVPGVEAGRRAGMRVVWVPHPSLFTEFKGMEKEVLAGRMGLVKIGNEEQLGEIDDGWAEHLQSLENFPYGKYGIAVVS